MRVVDMMDQYNIGYGSVNHNRNRCLECGYENSTANLEVCPKCGSTHIDKLQRITGYLVGTTDRWNQAKLAELNDRVVHEELISTWKLKINSSFKKCFLFLIY